MSKLFSLILIFLRLAIKVSYYDNHPGQMKSNSMEHNFDFSLEAGKNTDSIVVSFVRVIHADVTSEPAGANQKPVLNDLKQNDYF